MHQREHIVEPELYLQEARSVVNEFIRNQLQATQTTATSTVQSRRWVAGMMAFTGRPWALPILSLLELQLNTNWRGPASRGV